MSIQLSFSTADVESTKVEWCACGSIHIVLGDTKLDFKRGDFESLTRFLMHSLEKRTKRPQLRLVRSQKT